MEIEKVEEIVNEKFVQHPELQRRLCARRDHIFEATLHPTYGIQALLKDHRTISWDKNTTKNNWMNRKGPGARTCTKYIRKGRNSEITHSIPPFCFSVRIVLWDIYGWNG